MRGRLGEAWHERGLIRSSGGIGSRSRSRRSSEKRSVARRGRRSDGSTTPYAATMHSFLEISDYLPGVDFRHETRPRTEGVRRAAVALDAERAADRHLLTRPMSVLTHLQRSDALSVT